MFYSGPTSSLSIDLNTFKWRCHEGEQLLRGTRAVKIREAVWSFNALGSKVHVSDSGDHGLTAWEIYLQMHAWVKDMIRITATCLACVQRCLKGYSCIPQIGSIKEEKQCHSQPTLLYSFSITKKYGTCTAAVCTTMWPINEVFPQFYENYSSDNFKGHKCRQNSNRAAY